MLGTTRAVADIAQDHGLRAVFHPHAGGYVEFDDEIERLLETTTRSSSASTPATWPMPACAPTPR